MNPCDFRYNIGDAVHVAAIKEPCCVLQRCDRGAGVHDYQVVWWMDGKRNVEWLVEWELSNG